MTRPEATCTGPSQGKAVVARARNVVATNGVNITKLESYIIDADFTVAQFFADIEGHPGQRLVRLALEELGLFSREVKILGVYPPTRSAPAGATRAPEPGPGGSENRWVSVRARPPRPRPGRCAIESDPGPGVLGAREIRCAEAYSNPWGRLFG